MYYSHEILQHKNLKNDIFYNCILLYCRLTDCELKGETIVKNNIFTNVTNKEIVFGTPYELQKINNGLHGHLAHNSFTGWKKARSKNGHHALVELFIPEGTKRTLPLNTDLKMRVEYAKVISIYNLNTKKYIKTAYSGYDGSKYTVGQTVYPDHFDDNLGNICSHGIHLFQNREDAVKYVL